MCSIKRQIIRLCLVFITWINTTCSCWFNLGVYIIYDTNYMMLDSETKWILTLLWSKIKLKRRKPAPQRNNQSRKDSTVNKKKTTVKLSYLSRTVLLVLSKINVILTVRQIILSHPLTVVLSSLGSNLYNSHCAAKINGEPLVSIVVARAPCSHPGPCSPEKEPSIVGRVVFVPAWGSSNLYGSYATILHS